MQHKLDAGAVKGKQGFTLIELVIVVATVTMLAGVFAQAYANVGRKPGILECRNNLRQVGTAIQQYTKDHQDSLPGPLWQGMFHTYAGANAGVNVNRATTWSLAYHVAPYLGLPAPDTTVREVPALKCPVSFSMSSKYYDPEPMRQWVSYVACEIATNRPGAAIPPFPNSTDDAIWFPLGRPSGGGSPEITPAKLGSLKRPSEQWVMTDADQANVPGGSIYNNTLPSRPVHSGRPGQSKAPFVRNYQYFDGSVRVVETAK